MAITCLLQLWEKVHVEHGVKFIRTRQLNQYSVENLFSIVRAKGGARDNPDAQQFRAALRQIMVDAVMQPGSMSNCEEDVDDFQLTLSNTTPLERLPTCPMNVPVLSDVPHDIQALVDSHPPELSLQESNAIAYIGGYVVRKIRDKVCMPCKQKISSVMSANSSNHAFLCTKAITDSKVGLFVPSSGLTDVLEQMEERYVRLIDSRMCIPGIKSSLISSFMESVDWGSMVCNSCRLQSLIAGLMVNIRLHHTIRLCNTTLRDKRDRKNRKVLKFSHL